MTIDGAFEVVGAQAPLAFFTTLAPARVAHGYLFTGPAGVGKKTFARRFAQSCLCELPKTTVLGYCGTCTACTLFAARTHPDFVEAEGTIKIGREAGAAAPEEVTARDLVRELSLHGYRSRYRIVLLGDVAFATHEAANALLKFFEEPPAGVIVVLTTSAPGTLLPTVRSRFVEIAFGPLAAADVERVLIAEGLPVVTARLAAEASLGSITRARSIAGDGDDGIRTASFRWFAAAVLGETPSGSFLRLDDRGSSGAEKRALVIDLIEVVRVALRDWAALAIGAGDVPLLAADQRERLERLPRRDVTEIVRLLAAVAPVERMAHTNVSAGLVVEYLRMQLAPAAAAG